jgi:hypothetical protein
VGLIRFDGHPLASRPAPPATWKDRPEVRKPLTAGLLRMRPTTLMQLAHTDPATRLGELWPAA